MKEDCTYQLALSSIPGINATLTRRLLEHFGDIKEIFRASQSSLMEVVDLGEKRAAAIATFNAFHTLDNELSFLEKYSISPLFLTDKAYPYRLHRCPDAPILLFFKGSANLNPSRVITIIGTRSPSEYGRQVTEKLVKDLSGLPDTLIVSGLAYGIDAVAHEAALDHHLPTVAVLAHGLDQIYPPANKPLAKRMVAEGGLLTSFRKGNDPEIYNFPKRNHIVAGISDAVIVTETRSRGGSLLTIDNALAYERKRYAIPGRISDEKSMGCNLLIARGKAQLLTGARQLIEEMDWQKAIPVATPVQTSLFASAKAANGLTDSENAVFRLFGDTDTLSLTEIHIHGRLAPDLVSSTLVNLELMGLISSLPGRRYKRCG